MIDLLIAPCGQLVTLAGPNGSPRRGSGLNNLGLVETGALGINQESGTIEFAGALAALPREALTPDCRQIDAARQVVMPGFIDSHTHLVFAGSRADEFFSRASGVSYQEIARAGGGISKTMECTRAATEAELLDLARSRLKRLNRNGTTTLETKSGYGLSVESELQALLVIKALRDSESCLVFGTYLGAHLIPPEFTADREQYVDQVIETLGQVGREALADFYDIFVDPLAFTQAEAQRIVEAGQNTSLGLRLHADEFGDDGTAAWGVAHGALSVDHLGGIGDTGIAALANSDTVATLLPATMFFSGHGEFAPARKMVDAGCAIALATDLNPGSSLVYSMPFVMTLAVLEMQLSAEECIVASTINGAHALGIADQVGSLEPGKRADVLIMDLPHYREIPYHVGANMVQDVFIRGCKAAM